MPADETALESVRQSVSDTTATLPVDDEAPAALGSLPMSDGDAAVARGKASGWFAADPDGVVRGWCLDRRAPQQRLRVAVLVDGVAIGTAVADRLHPTLRERGDNDGYAAFACAIPAAYRDGEEHRLAVQIAHPDYEETPLKTKTATFTFAAASPAPTVTLTRLIGDAIEGVLTGHALGRELDVWIDGVRLGPDDFGVDWLGAPGPSVPFRLRLADSATAALLASDASIAYPGMREIRADGARVSDLLRLTFERLDDETYRVVVGLGVPLADGIVLRGEFRTPGGAAPIATIAITLRDNQGQFSFRYPGDDHRALLQLFLPGGLPLGRQIAFAASGLPRRLLGNGGFERWRTDLPDQFAAGAGVTVERGFYAFPPPIKAQHLLSGKTLVATLPEGEGETLVLTQPLARSTYVGLEPVEVGVGFLVRASGPVALTLRLRHAEGTVDLFDGVVGTRWKSDWRTVTLSRPDTTPGPLAFEFAVRPLGQDDGPTVIEVAGLHVGEPGLTTFADQDDVPARQAWVGADINFVVNADLTSWPNGLAFTQRRSRAALADGWTYFNRRSSGEVAVATIPAPTGEVGRYALSLTVDTVPEYCRIEVALDCQDLAGRGRMSFDARCRDLPASAGGTYAAQRWSSIDQIYILRRDTRREDGRLVARDTTLARVARRVVVTDRWETNHFEFTIDPVGGGEFDLARQDDELVEFLAVLEVRRPIALDLYNLSVKLGRGDAAPAPAPLRLEDRNIGAQVGVLRGIEAWGSPDVVRPAVIPPPSVEARDPLRWSWKHAALGSVEVAICVYNAADETMACLASLVGSSGVPHTVRIINDGSDADTRQRIAAFVADRPWMTLVDNDGNRGYTHSANRAVLESAADWVILLNSDTVVSAGWIEGLLEAAASDPATAFVGAVSNAATYQSVPDLYDGAGKWAVNDLPRGWQPADLAGFVRTHSQRHFPTVPLLNGFCTLIRRAIFEEVGGLNEAAFPAGYGEENDLCLRVRKAGYNLRVADHVYVYHTKSASFGSARRTELAKAGDKALRALHQDIDFGALGRDFLQTPALVELRETVRRAYAPDAETTPAASEGAK